MKTAMRIETWRFFSKSRVMTKQRSQHAYRKPDRARNSGVQTHAYRPQSEAASKAKTRVGIILVCTQKADAHSTPQNRLSIQEKPKEIECATAKSKKRSVFLKAFVLQDFCPAPGCQGHLRCLGGTIFTASHPPASQVIRRARLPSRVTVQAVLRSMAPASSWRLAHDFRIANGGGTSSIRRGAWDAGPFNQPELQQHLE